MKSKPSRTLLALLCVLPVQGSAAGPAEPKVVVPGIHAYEGVPDAAAHVLEDLLLEALMSRHGIRALGPSDVRAILNAEEQKQLLACSDESCMAELAGAMGADWLVAGSVGKLEDLYVLTLQLIEAKEARVTSRAKATMTSLKQAPEKMEKLVDDLLGRKGRSRPAPAVLSATGTSTPTKAMSLRKFCQQVKEYQEALATGPWKDELVKRRRQLLQDLVATPFKRKFEQKLSCFWDRSGWYETRIRRQLYVAPHPLAARDAKLRRAEYFTMIDQIKTLKEEYLRGLEMEKNGTGTRLRALPFEVEKVLPAEPAPGKRLNAYRSAYELARETLDEMFDAVRKGDQDAFLAGFVPRNPEKGRTSPKYVYESLLSRLKNGYRLESCPFAILDADDVESAARRLEEKQELVACWRYMKDDFASTDTVFMKKHDGRWLIDRW